MTATTKSKYNVYKKKKKAQLFTLSREGEKQRKEDQSAMHKTETKKKAKRLQYKKLI